MSVDDRAPHGPRRRTLARSALAAVTGIALVLATAGVATAGAREDTEPSATPSATPTVSSSPTPSSAASSSSSPSASATVSTAKRSVTSTTSKATSAARPAPTVAGYQRYYRPALKRGDADGDVYHMKHVRELQYRLRWVKMYTGPVTGRFGALTEAAVKKFQTAKHLRATGRVDLASWQALIAASTRATKRVPTVCKRSGWHACYDRQSHQVFLYRSGVLWNVWLVRGGSSTARTDTGTYKVFARYVRKKSSLYQTLMLYFQKFHGGEGLHGSVMMIDPFVGHSHGCVNMYIPDAKVLWDMTHTQRLVVTVYGAWA